MSGEVYSNRDDKIKAIFSDLSYARKYAYESIIGLMKRKEMLTDLEEKSNLLEKQSTVFQGGVLSETAGKWERFKFHWKHYFLPKIISFFSVIWTFLKWLCWRTPCQIYFYSENEEENEDNLTFYLEKISI